MVAGINAEQIFGALHDAAFLVVQAVGNHRGDILQHRAISLV